LGILAFAGIVAGCDDSQQKSAQPTTHSQGGDRVVQLHKFDFVQPKMGTVFNIVLYAPDKDAAQKAADAAFARVDELNAVLSDYDPESELSRLSRRTVDGPMPEPVKVGEDLWRVLEQSQKAAEMSDGAFDVTVGPFVRLWRRSRELGQLPRDYRLDEARKSVGRHLMKLDPETKSVQLLAPKMRLDVGGIAKGYVAQQVLALLKDQFGIDRAAVGAAGDLAVGKPPPGKDYWRVAIQSLEKPDEVAGYVKLREGQAVSTAGDTYRYVDIDGKRYSHIIDPRTGLGLTRRIGVTAIAPDCTTSDWLDTAVSILGAEKGVALAERIPGAAVRITTLEGPDGKPVVIESKRFRDYLLEPETDADTRREGVIEGVAE
jgi:thiamine biosynthesis lipoprotein